MCRRKAATEKIPVAPGLLKEAKLHFQRQIKQIQEWHQIPDDLIINFDQTPLPYVCTQNHTLHFKSGKSVSLVGKGKSKQITCTFSCRKSRIFLPTQLIFQDKTNHCYPAGIEFPERTTGVMRINSLNILNQLFFHFPSQRELSWILKRAKMHPHFWCF